MLIVTMTVTDASGISPVPSVTLDVTLRHVIVTVHYVTLLLQLRSVTLRYVTLR